MLRRRRPTRSWRLHLDLNSVFGYAFDIYPNSVFGYAFAFWI
jgi:hypothetical protein